METPELGFLLNFNHLKSPKNPDNLNVFHCNHVPQKENDVCNYQQQICIALSNMQFSDQIVYAQFWAAIGFKTKSDTATVLTARGQPFAHSNYTDEFWSYRLACLDHNSYVNHVTKLCIGFPARVFLNGFPEWVQDIRYYTDILYPQPNDATRSNIRGSLTLPVINEGDQLCIGVLEFVSMTNLKENCFHEMMSEVCRALEEVGLKSFVQNENINRDISKDYTSLVKSSDTATSSRKSKSCKVTCSDITKLFGMPKADAAKICGISSENTFKTVQDKYGIDVWPCVRQRVEKSSAHNALELGRAYHISSDETLQIKLMNDLLSSHARYINCDDDIVDKHNWETADGKRVREQHDKSLNPDVLEPYYHINKRSRI